MSVRQLPSVDALARSLSEDLPMALTVEVARWAVEEARGRLARGEPADPRALADAELAHLARQRPIRVINATGVLLHTNLGRAPLAAQAAQAAREAATSYGNLELDLTQGRRGGRGAYLRRLLRALTGAEDALAVNNNAAALFLTLAALARDRPVPVSRGELIEIGGSFRLPELMAASGARLVEVGTTNRTRLSDYQAALTEDTALVLKIHASNYRIVGFSESAGVPALAELAHRAGLPLVVDAGSGLLDADVPWLPGPPPGWLAQEPGIRQLLASGADLVLFSGDKLLGGPQAGMAVGRADLVGRLAGHPIARAVRCDGPTLAALTATFELYAGGKGALVPFWAMASVAYEELEARAKTVLADSGVAGEVLRDASVAGAGSVPGTSVPSPVVTVESAEPGFAERAWRSLLSAAPPVVARREEGALVIDLRAVRPEDDPHLAEALRAACRS